MASYDDHYDCIIVYIQAMASYDDHYDCIIVYISGDGFI